MSIKFYAKSLFLFIIVGLVVGAENYIDYGGRWKKVENIPSTENECTYYLCSFNERSNINNIILLFYTFYIYSRIIYWYYLYCI